MQLLITTLLAMLAGGAMAAPASPRLSNLHRAELRDFCSHIPPIGASEYEQRIVRLADELNAVKTDVFVMEPGASMFYFGNVTWKISERSFLLVVTAEYESFYICPAFEAGRAYELIGDATLYVWQEDESPFDILYQVLGAPTNWNVAVEHEARFFIPEGISKSFGSTNTVISGLDILRNVRGLKTSAEIDIMRCANEATKRVIATVSEYVYEGVSESEIKDLVDDALHEAGLSDTWNLVLFGENAAYPHGTGNRVTLKNGDLILIDCGGSLLGYQSDISRTFPFGPYNSTQLLMWNTVREAQVAALNAIRPGVPVSAIDEAARAVAEENGFGGDYETFTHRLGHGIGLQGHEEIYLVRGNDWPMTPGMCFSVEPGLYIVGLAGVRLEDIVCATAEPPYYELFGAESTSIDDPFNGH